jgi:hypothetical protein
MKTKLGLFLVTLILILGFTTSPKPIEGAWNLVYAQTIDGGKQVWRFPGNSTGSDLKMWTGNHFTFVGRFKTDTTYNDNYGGGTYTLEGTHYLETILYHTITSAVGTKIKMLIEIKGDSLIQTYPVDDNWKVDKNKYNIEKYVRLK